MTTELLKAQTDLRDRNRKPPVWKSRALKRKIDRPKITIVLPTVPIGVPNFGRHVPNFELDPLNFGKDTAQLTTDSRAIRTAFLI